MAHCLFTNELLGPETHEEHTIPRSLGGRIRSREVSSSSFNNRCSNTVDRYLFDVYSDIMATLGPALASDYRSGDREVEMPGHPERLVINGMGQLALRGTFVAGRDPMTNRPTQVVGPNEEAIRRIIEPNAPIGATLEVSTVAPPSDPVVYPERAVIHPAIELAALKAALLSFDHLLRNSEDRFTRSPQLDPVRRFVRSSIMDESIEPEVMQRFSLGLQYEKQSLYDNLRGQVDFSRTPFEHVLIASANVATRTVDVVIWLLGVGPHGFRVCTDWEGDSFSYVIANGVLRDTICSDAIKLQSSHLLCKPTVYRSYSGESRTERDESAAVDVVATHLSEGDRRAVSHVEMNCDAIVTASLEQAVHLNPTGNDRVATAVRMRLETLFNLRIRDDSKRLEFNRTVDGVLADAPPDAAPPSPIDWSGWLGSYRTALEALQPSFGLPGESYTSSRSVVSELGGNRALGE